MLTFSARYKRVENVSIHMQTLEILETM